MYFPHARAHRVRTCDMYNIYIAIVATRKSIPERGASRDLAEAEARGRSEPRGSGPWGRAGGGGGGAPGERSEARELSPKHAQHVTHHMSGEVF